MKKLLLLLTVILCFSVLQVEAKKDPNKWRKIQNKVHYAKRHHQNRIFQYYLQSSQGRKGLQSRNYAPKGQNAFKVKW